MFGPGGVLFLLRHELLLTWRNFRASGKGRHVRRLIFYSIVITALGFGGYWVARLISGVPPEPTPMALGISGAVFAILFSLMLSQALMLITESLYQRGDLDLLLASPLPPWRILIVRMAAIAINVSVLYVILALAVFVWLPFFGGWEWMSFAPSILLLSLFATAAALVLARFMFVLIGPKNTRVVAQIVAGLIGAAFFLGIQAQNLAPETRRADAYRLLFEAVAPVMGDASSPISLPARAAFGVGWDLAIWAGVAIGAYALAVWWYGARFAAEAASTASLGARKRRKESPARRMQGGVAASLVRKEWRLLIRDPLLLSQILTQLLYLLPLFLVFASRLSGEGTNRFAISGFAAGFVLLVTSLAASLAWLTISAEDAPDLIAAAPISRDEVENAKAFAAATPAALLLIPPVIGAAVFVSPMAAFWLLLGGAAAIISTCLIAVWHQAPGNRKQFRRRTRGSLLLNFGRAFVGLGWVSATGLAVAGMAVLAIIPAIIALGLVLALHESRPKEPVAA